MKLFNLHIVILGILLGVALLACVEVDPALGFAAVCGLLQTGLLMQEIKENEKLRSENDAISQRLAHEDFDRKGAK